MHDPIDLIGDPLLVSLEGARSARSPELRLLAAILEDACFCVAPTALVSRETRASTLAWIRGETASEVLCSFREICDILDLDEDATRARLLRLPRGRRPGPGRLVAAERPLARAVATRG